MKLKHWIQYALFHDTTWHGQFRALRPLLLGPGGFAPLVVDVGANDGFYSSNSYPFIRRGWRAILIEPDPGAFQRAARLHSGNPRVTILNLACSDAPGAAPLILSGEPDRGSHSALAPVGSDTPAGNPGANSVTVRVERLETVLDQHEVPRNFGLLTVDTEGHDDRVIRGLNLARYRPRVIISEKNPDDDLKFDHLRRHGYQLHCTLEYDTIWIDSRESDRG